MLFQLNLFSENVCPVPLPYCPTLLKSNVEQCRHYYMLLNVMHTYTPFDLKDLNVNFKYIVCSNKIRFVLNEKTIHAIFVLCLFFGMNFQAYAPYHKLTLKYAYIHKYSYLCC